MWWRRWYPDRLIRLLPNLISLARLILAPFILWLIRAGEYERALLFGTIAGASDALDGYLARRLHAESRLGAYLDPIGDKLLLSGAFLVFWLNGVTPGWLTALVFGRDALILLFVAAAMLFTRIRDFAPTVWGKLSTIIQVLTALILLISETRWGPAIQPLVWPAIGATVLGTGWSAIHYAWVAVRMLRGAR